MALSIRGLCHAGYKLFYKLNNFGVSTKSLHPALGIFQQQRKPNPTQFFVYVVKHDRGDVMWHKSCHLYAGVP
jgi:hypothetical protein